MASCELFCQLHLTNVTKPMRQRNIHDSGCHGESYTYMSDVYNAIFIIPISCNNLSSCIFTSTDIKSHVQNYCIPLLKTTWKKPEYQCHLTIRINFNQSLAGLYCEVPMYLLCLRVCVCIKGWAANIFGNIISYSLHNIIIIFLFTFVAGTYTCTLNRILDYLASCACNIVC